VDDDNDHTPVLDFLMKHVFVHCGFLGYETNKNQLAIHATHSGKHGSMRKLQSL